MRKLLLLLPILLLTACSSLDFQIRTLHTANMYDGIYYNTPTRINSNFVFFQPNIYDNFWWNYSLTYPLNWNHFSSYGLTYNWRYTRWNSNQWLLNPYYDQFRIQPITPRRVVQPNRGRNNTQPPIIRTPRTRTRISVPTPPRTDNNPPKRVYVPRHVQPRTIESPIRNRNTQTPRIQQPQPRVQPTPRPPQRTQSPVRQQQTPKTTRGGINIKQ